MSSLSTMCCPKSMEIMVLQLLPPRTRFALSMPERLPDSLVLRHSPKFWRLSCSCCGLVTPGFSFPSQTYGRTLIRSRWARRSRWSTRCCCSAARLRGSHRPR